MFQELYGVRALDTTDFDNIVLSVGPSKKQTNKGPHTNHVDKIWGIFDYPPPSFTK